MVWYVTHSTDGQRRLIQMQSNTASRSEAMARQVVMANFATSMYGILSRISSSQIIADSNTYATPKASAKQPNTARTKIGPDADDFTTATRSATRAPAAA
jgi:hypothetical protein